MSPNKPTSVHTVPESVADSVANIKMRFEQLTVQPCNLKGEAGFFTSQKSVDLLEMDIKALVDAVPEGKDNGALIQMNEELQVLRKQKLLAEDRLKAAEATSSYLKGDLENLQESLSAQKRLSGDVESRLAKEKEPIVAELNNVRKELAEARKENRKAMSSTSDIDELKPTAEKASKLASEVTRLNNTLQAVNTELAMNRANTLAMEKKVAELKAAKADADAAAEKFKKATFAEVAGEPDHVQEFTFSSKFLGRIWPEASLQYLREAAEAKRTNARETAYKLMLAAKSGDPRDHTGFVDLAQSLFKSFKVATPERKAKLAALTNSLMAEIRKGSRKINFASYHQQLSEIMDFSQEKMESHAQTYPTGPWWQSLKVDLVFWCSELKTNYQKKRASFWEKMGYERRPKLSQVLLAPFKRLYGVFFA